MRTHEEWRTPKLTLAVHRRIFRLDALQHYFFSPSPKDADVKKISIEIHRQPSIVAAIKVREWVDGGPGRQNNERWLKGSQPNAEPSVVSGQRAFICQASWSSPR